MTWMCLPDSESPSVTIVPVEYEGNVEYGKGAKFGSREIIKASEHLEYYDDELDFEPCETGIKLAKPLVCDCSPDEAQEKIFSHLSDCKGFFIGLGGDHSVTPAFVKALSKKFDNLSVLVFDAHSDLRYSWNGSMWNHACSSRRIAENHKIGIVGVRSMDISEKEFAFQSENVKIMRASEKNFSDILSHLGDNVFVSVDVDVFDPSFIRNTGTPEPGGLGWYDVLGMLRRVFREKNVVGCDVVEFAPEENFRAEAFALSKLVYKMIGYKFEKK